MEKRNQVTVTVSGDVGCGKSAVYHEIVIALKSLGVEVSHADEMEYLCEAGIIETETGPDGNPQPDIHYFKPLVHMVEKVQR